MAKLWNPSAVQAYLVLALILCGVPLCGVAVAQVQVSYKDFGQPPGDIGAPTTTVSAIDGSGEIAGYYIDAQKNDHSFLISQGSFSRISFPGVASTRVLAINASRQMAGYFFGTDNKYHGFLLSGPGGAFTQIDAPGGAVGTHVTAMNDSGQIVGWYRDAARNDHGFLLSAGVYATIDAPGADQGTYTIAINNFGEILGYSADSGGPFGYEEHGYVFSKERGFIQQIDYPGAAFNITTVVGMNVFGEVAGYFSTGGAASHHTFLSSQGSFKIIDPPYPYSDAIAAAINDFDQIVGTYQINVASSGSCCGFLLSQGKYSTIVPPGGLRGNVAAINNAGQMAGVFYDASNVPHIFEADPICLNAGGDTDGDGLCDDWETDGLKVTVNGSPVFLDLKKMGADPKHKDVFVQLDTIPGGTVTQAALDVVIAAFGKAPVTNPDNTAGINLHIDNGPHSTMNPKTGDTWGDLSKESLVNDVANLGNLDAQGAFSSWNVFDSEKRLNFPLERLPVFHYAISEPGPIVDSNGNHPSSGSSRTTPGSDFIIAFSRDFSDAEVAGTFMHELGHNLGLRHGGADDINRKPNYLSVMNYAYQLTGLLPGNIYDYSRFGPDSDASNLMPILDEAHLDEATGLGTSSQPVGANALRYWSLRYCPGDTNPRLIKQLNQPIDWDCNHPLGQDDMLTDVAVAGVNADAGKLLKFHAYNDWANLIFTGTGIGSLAGTSFPPATHNIEATLGELQAFADFWAAQEQGQDSVPPTTTVTPSPQPNAAGWNNTNVTVTLRTTDNAGGSGVRQISYGATGAQSIATTMATGASAVITLTAEGQTTITYFATDIAGNAEAAHALTIQIDKTPPSISATSTPLPNVYGWNKNNVTVSFACSDSLSGLAPGGAPAATVVSTEAAGQSVSGTCTDIAGNSASATVANINIDKTPPAMNCSVSPSVLWPPNNKLVSVGTSVVVSDTLSGPAGFALLSVSSNEPDSGIGDIQGWLPGKPSTNGQLRAERLGTGSGRVYTFMYQGTDQAGNSATCSPVVVVPHDQEH